MANYIKHVTRVYFGFTHPLMTWEYHCFGYRKAGHGSLTTETTTVYLDTGDIKKDRAVTKYAYFGRHEEYPKNPIFVILELLMSLVSRLRVGFSKLLLIGYIICNMIGELPSSSALPTYLISGFAALYGASILIALLGFVVRKAFKLDEKLDEVCEENKWKKWSEYQDA